MRKFRVFSDLHLEGRVYTIPELPTDGETTLILAGDIHTGTNAIEFLKPLVARFHDVVYVMGNHEFYHNDMDEVRKWWRTAARSYCNLYVLDNGGLEYHDVRIIGTTLWTPTNDPMVELYMSDYSYISYHGETLKSADTRELFLRNVDFLEEYLRIPFEGKTVVVTHHAPVEACVQKQWEGHPLTKCFHADLEWLLEKYDIDFWFHGHMHQTVYTMYKGVEIYANPRGYAGSDSNVEFQEGFVLEV